MGTFTPITGKLLVCISQMVDSYILEFNNATLRIVAPGTNGYFDLNVAT